ncbi:MAG: hypothetical protein ACRYGR_08765 [Janthinobacterium lividum]
MRHNSLKPYLVISTAMVMLSTVANATSTDIENFKSEAEQSSVQSHTVAIIDMVGVSKNDNILSQPSVEALKIKTNTTEESKKAGWFSFGWSSKAPEEKVSEPIKSDLEIAEQTKNPLATLPSIEKVEDKYPFEKTVVIRRIGYLGGWLLGIGSDIVEISENEYNNKEFLNQHYPGYELVKSKQEVLQGQNNLPVTEPIVTTENSNDSISFELDSLEKGTEQTSQKVVKLKSTINSEVLRKVAHSLPENQDLTMSFISNFVQAQQIANEVQISEEQASIDAQQTTPVNVIESIKQKTATKPAKNVSKNKKWNKKRKK